MAEISPVSQRNPSKQLSAKFAAFLNHHSPTSVSRHLRCILLDYIYSQLDNGLPDDFNKSLEELYELFELLDRASLEYDKG